MYELTPRLEAEIEDFAHLLATAPQDLIMATFESPPPKPDRPVMWCDQPKA